LSFSHFVELLQFDEPVQRVFYEVECIRGNWSVRELKRQIGSLYYERSGLSRNKKKLSEMVRQCAQTVDPTMTVRDPYVFEFLGLKSRDVMSDPTWKTSCWTSCRSSYWSSATAFVSRHAKNAS